jgi:hypothetical protein
LKELPQRVELGALRYGMVVRVFRENLHLTEPLGCFSRVVSWLELDCQGPLHCPPRSHRSRSSLVWHVDL